MTTIRKITIPNPCQQPWQQMTPNAEGRHCDHCAKTVIDFASMTDTELIRYLITHNNVCGSFSEPQLNSVNIQLYTQSLKAETGWKKWLMTIALFGSTLFYKASGQTTTVTAPKVEQSPLANYPNGFALGKIAMSPPAQREIKGQILDDDCQPLPGATIRLPGTNLGTQTDTNGRFELHVPLSAKQLSVSFIGFKTATMQIDSVQDKIYDLKLTLSASMMGEVVIIKQPLYKRLYYRYIRRPFRAIFN